MPEGPTLVILKAQLQPFKNKKVIHVSGNSQQPIDEINGKILRDIRTWGKQLLVCYAKFTVRIHFLLFGSYSIGEPKENRQPRLSLTFSNGTVYFYACSVKFIRENLDELYQWEADIMSDHWNPKRTRKLLKADPRLLICDALLTQDLFAGSGNIIKNEVLFRTRVHPLNTIADLPPRKLTEIIQQTRQYAFDFLEWKKAFVLRKHWLAHNKSICPRCHIPFQRAYLGKFHRRTFYCENCQKFYPVPKKKKDLII